MNSSLPFSGKTALVTGSGRGIGRAIALYFARNGADVVVNFFRNRPPAEETAAEIEKLGRRALLVKADVGDLDDLNRLFDEIGQAFGGLDIFIHNAASGYNRPALEQKPKGWDWTMNINARSLLFAAQRAVRIDGETRRREHRQHHQPGLRPGPAGLRGGRSQQSRHRITHPLPGGGTQPQEYHRQRGLPRHCRNRCAEALRFAAPGRPHPKSHRGHAGRTAGQRRRMWPKWSVSYARRPPA